MKDINTYDLRNGLGYRLTMAAKINQLSFDHDLGKIGLTRQMWCVLVAVGEQGITLPTEIARYIGINRTSASRSLRQMTAKGLLARGRGTQDRRCSHVALTAKGQEALDAARPMAVRVQQGIESRLNADEVETLSRILDKMLFSSDKSVAGV